MSEQGWIEWKGGDCPVSDDDKFEFLYRAGRKITVPCLGSRYRWEHLGANHDIVAYRVIPSEADLTPS